MDKQHQSFTEKFRSFVTQHDHLFTALGAFLVVSAFYTQDVKLPPLAKMSGDIDAAITESNDLGYINSKMSDLSEQVSDGFQPDRSKSPFVNDQRNILASSHDFDAAQDDLNISLIIAGRLPMRPNALIAKGTEIKSRVVTLRSNQSTVLSDLDAADLAGRNEGTALKDIPGYSKLIDEATPFAGDVASFKKSVEMFKDEVDSEAETQSSLLKTRRERWERISEALVILGFIAGLLSKLLKLPALGGDAG